jgi:hypothetical protein
MDFMSHQAIFPKSFAWYVTLGLLFSLSVSYSDDFVVPVTVTNRTAHYLHLSINDESFTFVAPGSAVQTEVTTDGVTIHAVYAPGQNVSGKFTQSYPTVRRQSVSPGSTSCSNGSSTCTSTSTGPSEVRTPLPVQVEIRPSDLR